MVMKLFLLQFRPAFVINDFDYLDEIIVLITICSHALTNSNYIEFNSTSIVRRDFSGERRSRVIFYIKFVSNDGQKCKSANPAPDTATKSRDTLAQLF